MAKSSETSETNSSVAQNDEFKPDYFLTVVHPFAHYPRGALITGPDEIAFIEAGENVSFCRKTPAQ